MKVLQINATYGSGSTGTIVKDIQNCCLQNNIDCYVAYSLSNLPECDIRFAYKIGSILGKKTHAFCARINGKQGYFSYISTWKLIRYIDKLQPDIIHLHNLHSNYVNLNMLLKHIANKNIPTVVTLHDCWFFTGGCFHYTNAGCKRWLESCGNCPKKKLDTPAYLFDKSAEILRDRYKYFGQIPNLTVVGVSEWIKNDAVKTVFRNTNACYIYNGVDLSIFKPTESDFRTRHNIEGKYVILGPASKWLDPVNAMLFKSLTDEMDENTVMVLFGCGSSTLHLPKNVIPIGFISDKYELAKIYSMADVFINVTREDSLPTINLEAQACGTPVITHNITGAGETVTPLTGAKIPVNDYKSLKTALQVIRNRGKKAMKDDIIAHAVNEFDINKNYIKYINLYKSIINDK